MIGTYISTGLAICALAAILYIGVVSPLVCLYMGIDMRSAGLYESGFYVVTDQKPYAFTRVWGYHITWLWMVVFAAAIGITIVGVLGYIVMNI